MTKPSSGRRPSERAALEEATGRTDNATALGESIRRLVELARAWLGREDGRSKILCTAAGLTAALVDATLAAGTALTGAATAVTLGGRRGFADAPEVNLIEGSVLFEMEEARRSFDEAREVMPVVSRLVPGPSTRHVLGSKKSKPKAEPAPAPSPALPVPS